MSFTEATSGASAGVGARVAHSSTKESGSPFAVSRRGRFFFIEPATSREIRFSLLPVRGNPRRHCEARGRAAPVSAVPLPMLSAFVPRCLAVIKRIHDALPARVQAVTDAWPSEVLVTAVVVALLLNIYVFLWNVKAHESAKTRRSKRAAGKKSR